MVVLVSGAFRKKNARWAQLAWLSRPALVCIVLVCLIQMTFAQGRTYSEVELRGQRGDPDVVFLYQGHPLAIRVVSVRDQTSGDGHHGDWIAVIDTVTGEYKIVNPKVEQEARFTFADSNGKIVYRYKMTLLDHTSRDGKTRKWMQLTDADETKSMMNAKGKDVQFTVEWLQARRRALAVSIDDRLRLEEREYYMVPQVAPLGCRQFLERRSDNTAGDVVGVACTRRVGRDGYPELINGGNVELGYIMGPPNYYCIRPNLAGGWEAYMGEGCRPQMDNPQQ